LNQEIYETEEQISKSQIVAERLLKRIHLHSFDDGGILSLITGGMGSGKTSTIRFWGFLVWLSRIIKNFQVVLVAINQISGCLQTYTIRILLYL
jgi:hypothetical protein